MLKSSLTIPCRTLALHPIKLFYMNKIYCYFIVCCLIVTNLSAQSTTTNSAKHFNYKNGKVTVVAYGQNIFKLTYQPKDYTTNENITDAVILSPSKIFTIPFSKKGDTIKIGNAKIVGTNQNNEFRGFSFLLNKTERIYGGGERALPLNRRGYKLNLYNNPWYGYGEGADNLNYSVPFFTSSNGYGLFFDNASKGYADIGKTNPDILEAGFMSGELNVYIITGKDNKEILTAYQSLTGKQPLPPRWALGNLMSRFGYTSEKQVKDIAGKMQGANIPVSAIIFDLFWFGDSIKGTMGNLDWVNKTKWPDPNKMVSDFKKDNINTVLITEPFMLKNTKAYNASEQYLAKDSNNKPFMITDFYFGVGGLIDIFRKDAGNWIWNYHYKKQIDNGIAAWWTDLGEPEKHPAAMMHNAKDLGVNRMLKADEVHNIYGHYWNKNLFEHYAKEYPDTRLFHLNRSGFAGSQRYSIFPWTGDVSRSWGGLRAQLTNLLGMSMSGIPYAHSDAGGFAGGEGDNELYIRWLQFAAYTPIFRPHGTALYEVEKAAFSFPSEAALIDSPFKYIAKNIIENRYAMMPYNYSLAYKQARYGEPLMRPLYYEFPKDTTACKIEDEYMWGSDILVAPVTEKGAKTKKIYFPSGYNWFVPGFFLNETIQGGTTVDYNVENFNLPVFYKEGSFIYKEENNSMDLCYLNSKHPSKTELLFDDGLSKNSFADGKFGLLKMNSEGTKGKKLKLNISLEKGKNYVHEFKVDEFGLAIIDIDQPTYMIINNKKILVRGSDDFIELNTEADRSFNCLYDKVNKQIMLAGVWYRHQALDIEIGFK